MPSVPPTADFLTQHASLLVFLVAIVGLMAFVLVLWKVLRPARLDPEKETTYECGEEPVGSAWIQFNIRFYVFALMFIIFDVEAVFLLPWVVVFRDLSRTPGWLPFGKPVSQKTSSSSCRSERPVCSGRQAFLTALTVLFAVLSGTPAIADPRVQFTPEITVHGQTLPLRGTGRLVWMRMVTVYDAALNLPADVPGRDVLRVPKRLELRYHISIKGEKFGESAALPGEEYTAGRTGPAQDPARAA